MPLLNWTLDRRTLLKIAGTASLALSTSNLWVDRVFAQSSPTAKIDPARVVTGYDFEMLVGKDFILTIAGAAYDAELIPHEKVTDSYAVKLQRPTDVAILPTDEPSGVDDALIDITVAGATVSFDVLGQQIAMDFPFGLTTGWRLDIQKNDKGRMGVFAHFNSLTWPQELIDDLKQKVPGQSDAALQDILAALKGAIQSLLADESFQLLELPSNIATDPELVGQKPMIRRINQNGGFQQAIGIYLMLELEFTHSLFGPVLANRQGNIYQAKTFLPASSSFAFGAGPLLPTLLAEHVWSTALVAEFDFLPGATPIPSHYITESYVPFGGTKKIPLGDEIVGEQKSLSAGFIPSFLCSYPSFCAFPGGIEITHKSTYFLTDPAPDPDITIKANLYPYLDHGDLKINVSIPEPDIDTGLVGDILAFFTGGFLGTTIGALLGVPGLGFPLSVGGVVALEEVESLAEGMVGGLLTDKSVSFFSIIDRFPSKIQHIPLEPTSKQIVNLFDDLVINDHGIAIAGHTVVQDQAQTTATSSSPLAFEPQKTTIYDINGPVRALAVQPGDKVLVGGQFTYIATEPSRFLARLNPDGAVDHTFNPAEWGQVYALAVQPDGQILLGGRTAQLPDGTRRYLARLDANGVLDTTFNPILNGNIRGLAVQPDSKILLAGQFTEVNSQLRRFIARLHPNGDLDDSFSADVNPHALSLAIQTDGKILLGGRFTVVNNQPRRFLVRLLPDGTTDASFTSGAEYPAVTALAVQNDGKILLVDASPGLGGSPRDRIARLTSNGSVDVVISPSENYHGCSLAKLQNGNILLAGHLIGETGTPQVYITHLPV